MWRRAVAAVLALAGGSGMAGSQETPPTIPIGTGVFTLEQAARGEERYRAMCSRCHGRDLRALYAEVPSLASYAFRSNWPGRPLSTLFEAIRYTMPMIARQTMPRGRTDQREFLSPQVSVDLTAYILAFNGFPAGAEELPPDPEYLRRIEITEPTTSPDAR
jgi:cytochrome c